MLSISVPSLSLSSQISETLSTLFLSKLAIPERSLFSESKVAISSPLSDILSEVKIAFLKEASKVNRLIVFTDPDSAGESIKIS